MGKKAIEAILQFGLGTLLALGVATSSAHAASLRFDAELETPKITDTGSGTIAADGNTLVIKLKNGTIKLSPFDVTEKTVQVHTVLYVRPDGASPASIDETSQKPNYNSTFLTNLNMDAELREMRTDGTLLYRLKLNPHPIAQLK